MIAEALPVVEGAPLVVVAVAGLFIIAACFFAIGLLKLVEAVSRAFFGTISGAVAWIPFAGNVVEHSLHKVEQKISHGIGSAEKSLDSYVAWTWHNMARLAVWTGHEIASQAQTTWQLAQQARHFLMARETYHAIGEATKPLKAKAASTAKAQANDHAHTKALQKSVAQGVYPRLKAGEVYDRTVTRPATQTIRSEAKAAEAQAIHLFRWLSAHRLGVATAVFTGAVAIALRNLGGRWIRCKNWRAIGSHVCGLPWSLIEALLGLGLAFAVVIDPRKTAELAVGVEDAMESIIRKIAD
jgi:hypothetical protein